MRWRSKGGSHVESPWGTDGHGGSHETIETNRSVEEEWTGRAESVGAEVHQRNIEAYYDGWLTERRIKDSV